MLPVLMLPAAPPAVPLRAVLFDLDDTLFDHLGTARAALAATQAEYPQLYGTDLDALSHRYGVLLEETHARLLAGEYTPEQARQQRFEQLLAPLGVGPAAAGEVAARHYAYYRQRRQALPGAEALLRALAPDYRLGIVSNNRLEEQQDKLRHLGLDALLPVLVTSEEVGVPKPDPRIFREALSRVGAMPAETVLVGDNWLADVVGARRVGIRPVWLNRLGGPAPEPGIAELRSLEPLAAVYTLLTGRPLPS